MSRGTKWAMGEAGALGVLGNGQGGGDWGGAGACVAGGPEAEVILPMILSPLEYASKGGQGGEVAIMEMPEPRHPPRGPSRSKASLRARLQRRLDRACPYVGASRTHSRLQSHNDTRIKCDSLGCYGNDVLVPGFEAKYSRRAVAMHASAIADCGWIL